MRSHSSFRLHKGLLEYQGTQDFDDHFTDVFGISPIDWDLKLRIASDLADAMQQCHVRFILLTSVFVHQFIATFFFCFAPQPGY